MEGVGTVKVQIFVLPSGRVFRGTVQDALAVVRGRARIIVKRKLKARVIVPKRTVQRRLPPPPRRPNPIRPLAVAPRRLPIKSLTRPRAMSFPLQTLMVRRALENRGVSSDLVDVEALVDPTLTLPENVQNILGQVVTTAPIPTAREVSNIADRTHSELCGAALEGCRQGQPGACDAYREEGCQPPLEVTG